MTRPQRRLNARTSCSITWSLSLILHSVLKPKTANSRRRTKCSSLNSSARRLIASTWSRNLSSKRKTTQSYSRKLVNLNRSLRSSRRRAKNKKLISITSKSPNFSVESRLTQSYRPAPVDLSQPPSVVTRMPRLRPTLAQPISQRLPQAGRLI